MSIVLLILNLLSSAVVFAVAMFFYLRHGRPTRLRHHANQTALLALSVGAFAALISAWRGLPTTWWEVLFRLGVAALAAKAWLHWFAQHRIGATR
ncbi:hypothetical protein ACHZ97_04245 [Lysobacter soli]|uniref:hypothetical protein n=1 Tax=Lysobacter soli TaxID=453783 RepID=UPI0037C9F596